MDSLSYPSSSLYFTLRLLILGVGRKSSPFPSSEDDKDIVRPARRNSSRVLDSEEEEEDLDFIPIVDPSYTRLVLDATWGDGAQEGWVSPILFEDAGEQYLVSSFTVQRLSGGRVVLEREEDEKDEVVFLRDVDGKTGAEVVQLNDWLPVKVLGRGKDAVET